MAIYHSARADGSEARQFWYDEYLLNAQIGRFSKPYVALMDGIVMGGGVGVSAHGSVRVVTDTTKMAMPEVGIGFIPDVGGTFILSRAPGLLGLHAALTGAPFGGARRDRAWASPTTSCPTTPSRDFKRRDHRRRHRRGAGRARHRASAESTAGPTGLDRRVLRRRDRRGHRRGTARTRRGAGQRRGQPDRHPLPHLAVGRAGGHPPRRQARHAGRRAAPGVSDVVRRAALARSRRGHPRPGHRQGPQPEMVARVAGGRHHRRRRGLLRAGRPRTGVLMTDELRDHPRHPRRARRHHHAEPAEGAQRAQQSGDGRSHHGRSRIRQRPGYRRDRHHRQREGVRGGRRHQGDGGAVVRRRVRRRLLRAVGASSPRRARRPSPRSRATRSAAAASWR